MSEQIGEYSDTSDIVEDPDVDMNSPVVISDSFTDKAPIGDSFPHEAPVGTNAESSVALLNPEDSLRYRTIWNEVQGRFVDDPRTAVQEADSLVSEVIEQLTQMFAHEHNSLESQWNQGNDVSTEDLRQALLRYHSFFNRLVI
jgi:hypothetical protein